MGRNKSGPAIKSGIAVREVIETDYTPYRDFPFPAALSEEDEKIKTFFLSLPDEEQLRLLRGCQSHGEFYDRVVQRIPKA